MHGDGGIRPNLFHEISQNFLRVSFLTPIPSPAGRGEFALSLFPFPGGRRVRGEGSDISQIPAQYGFLFNEMHRESLLRQRNRGSHPCRAAAHNQRSALHRHVNHALRIQQRGTRRGRAHQVFGFGGRRFFIGRVHPRALIADIRHLEQVRVQPSHADAVLEQRLVRERRATCNHYAVQPVLVDLLGNVFYAVLRTRIQIGFSVCNMRQFRRIFGDRWDIHKTADVRSA